MEMKEETTSNGYLVGNSTRSVSLGFRKKKKTNLLNRGRYV